MGGGLVLFGVGGNISGGLFDAFKTGGGGGSGNSLVEKRIDKNEAAVKAHPKSEVARKALVRDYFQLATAQTSSAQTTFPKDARDELQKAAANWKAYVALQPKKIDTSLARLALQVYAPGALSQPKEALAVSRLIAENEETANAYLNLVQAASLAGDTRLADLAGQKAVDLAPKSQRKAAKAQVKELKQAQAQAQAAKAAQGGSQGGSPGGSTQP
jgi:hypothetical protein